MTIEIKLPDAIALNARTMVALKFFLQAQTNRRVVGVLRYEGHGGRPNRRNRYMTRMMLELRAYRKTGNFEHLLNLANYAFLESEAPENRKFHFDADADSATRATLGGNIA